MIQRASTDYPDSQSFQPDSPSGLEISIQHKGRKQIRDRECVFGSKFSDSQKRAMWVQRSAGT